MTPGARASTVRACGQIRKSGNLFGRAAETKKGRLNQRPFHILRFVRTKTADSTARSIPAVNHAKNLFFFFHRELHGGGNFAMQLDRNVEFTDGFDGIRESYFAFLDVEALGRERFRDVAGRN